ncbi:MAG: hypothetical protein DMG97_11690 [Acidobacteria bacterium]|nr:MAG: hypothetical protein DMG97_11690 [Acidobacteriota bacterium]
MRKVGGRQVELGILKARIKLDGLLEMVGGLLVAQVLERSHALVELVSGPELVQPVPANITATAAAKTTIFEVVLICSFPSKGFGVKPAAYDSTISANARVCPDALVRVASITRRHRRA